MFSYHSSPGDLMNGLSSVIVFALGAKSQPLRSRSTHHDVRGVDARHVQRWEENHNIRHSSQKSARRGPQAVGTGAVEDPVDVAAAVHAGSEIVGRTQRDTPVGNDGTCQGCPSHISAFLRDKQQAGGSQQVGG